jgi:hypothetical protein
MTPLPRSDGLSQTKRSESQAVEEAAHRPFLRGSQPSPDLLRRDHAHPRLGPGPTQPDNPLRQGLPRSVSIRTVESSTSRPTSAGATGVTLTLGADPSCGIRVPIVHGVGEHPKRRLDVIPAPLIGQATLGEFGDECTPPSRTDSSIHLGHQLIGQRYVHTHVLRLATGVAVTRCRHSADMNMNGKATIYGKRMEDLRPGLRTIRDATTIDADGMYRASFTLKAKDGAPLKTGAHAGRSRTTPRRCRLDQPWAFPGPHASAAGGRRSGSSVSSDRRVRRRRHGPPSSRRVETVPERGLGHSARSEGFEPPTF